MNAKSSQTKLSHVKFFVMRARQILDRFNARRHALPLHVWVSEIWVFFGAGRKAFSPLQLKYLKVSARRCSGSWQCCWNETAGAYWFVPGTCGAAERGYEAPAHSLRVMAFPRCNTHTVIFLLSEPLANSLRIMAFPRSSAGTVNQAHTGRKQVRFGTDGHGERRGIWR